MSIFLFAAAAISGATLYVHVFVGGLVVARPLLNDRTLPRASKWLNYYCWHIATLLIAFFAIAFAWQAITQLVVDWTIWLSILSGSLSVLSALVAIKGGVNPFRFPSTTLFALVAVFGVLALMF